MSSTTSTQAIVMIASRQGQLGNRLFHYAQFLSFAKENSLKMLNPVFGEYARYFTSTCNSLFCPYPDSEIFTEPLLQAFLRDFKEWFIRFSPKNEHGTDFWDFIKQATFTELDRYATDDMRTIINGYLVQHLTNPGSKLIHSLPFTVVQLDDSQEVDLCGEMFSELLQKEQLILCDGWTFRARACLDKHASWVKEFFTPKQVHQIEIETLMREMRRQYDVVIGVHIRRGDYIQWEGGQYFFGIPFYTRVIKDLSQALKGVKLGFLVCSNEALDPQDFTGLEYRFGTGHLIEDMYSFAECDLLVGPPSTFTGWASFYGQKPMHNLTTETPMPPQHVIEALRSRSNPNS